MFALRRPLPLNDHIYNFVTTIYYVFSGFFWGFDEWSGVHVDTTRGQADTKYNQILRSFRENRDRETTLVKTQNVA